MFDYNICLLFFCIGLFSGDTGILWSDRQYTHHESMYGLSNAHSYKLALLNMMGEPGRIVFVLFQLYTDQRPWTLICYLLERWVRLVVRDGTGSCINNTSKANFFIYKLLFITIHSSVCSTKWNGTLSKTMAISSLIIRRWWIRSFCKKKITSNRRNCKAAAHKKNVITSCLPLPQ